MPAGVLDGGLFIKIESSLVREEVLLLFESLEAGTLLITTDEEKDAGNLISSGEFLSSSSGEESFPSGISLHKFSFVFLGPDSFFELGRETAFRVTLAFDHITGQEVTDYEISYRLDSVVDVGTDDGGTDLTSFNTVKVSSRGLL